MSTIDEKVVRMKFDNSQFESGVQGTMSTLDKLKSKLGFGKSASGFADIENAANRVKMDGLSGAVESISVRFSALQIMAVTALTNITNSAINTGKRMISALTIDPIKTGFQEYETKMNSIQTIMTNTASKGTTMQDVVKVIDDLNLYADKTIYNFQEMTRNIGTFTAAGVGLEQSASAIKGIANLAAASGSSSQQASTAMYQLSQALATGTVKLMDWNSVVNAGMGGELFQQALMETGRRHGVAVDDMIAKNGSFRDSLHEGWLTADILNETLNNFTIDGAQKYSQSMVEAGKWTEEQAAEMMKQATAMEEAATKVKTFTQLWETLKEAAQSGWGKTWELLIGDFEEAKTLLTSISKVIGGMIDESSDARNGLIGLWKSFGGRDVLIDGLRIIFESLMTVVKSVGDAFKEVFPPITYEHLMKLSVGVKELAYKFKMSEENADKLKHVFKALFSIVKIGTTVIGFILNLVFALGPTLSSVGQVILDMVSVIGKWISALTSSFDGMTKVGEGAVSMKDRITQAFKDAGDSIMNSKFVKSLKALNDATDKGTKDATGAVTDRVKKLTEGLGKINLGTILGAIGVGSLAAVAKSIIGFISELKSPLSTFKSIGSNISSVLNQVRDSLKTYQNQINAKILTTIAIAIGILTVSLLLLSTIDGASLAKSLGALAVTFGLLLGSMALFSKIGPMKKGISKTLGLMLGMSVTILILASAMKKLADLDWGQTIRGLVSVGVLMGILVATMKVMSSNKGEMVQGTAVMIALAIAIKILVSALSDIAGLSLAELGKGLIGLMVILASVAIFINKTKMVDDMFLMGVGLLVMAQGLKKMVDAITRLGELDWQTFATGFVGLAASLVMMAIAMKAMPTNLIQTALGLVIAAAGVRILAESVMTLSGLTLEGMATGLYALAISLGVMAIALNLMTGTLPGSAALLVAAIALAIFTPSLKSLSELSVEGIIKGLLYLAGVFIIFGVAAALLTPLLPAMLLLGVALALLGVGILGIGTALFLAGMGIQALGLGFTVLASLSSEGAKIVVDNLTTIITGIVTLIPTVATALAEGLIAFAQVVIEGAPILAEAFITVVSAILTTFSTLLPQLMEVFGQLIVALCELIVTNIPIIAESFLQLILGLLEVVATNIPLLIQAGVDIIVAFITGIATAVPQLVDAGFQAIITFINGLADAIRNNTQPMIDAVNNLFDAVVEAGKAVLTNSIGGFLDSGSEIMNSGFISGITGAIGNVISEIGNVILSAYNEAKTGVDKFFQVGGDMIQGMIDGIANAVDGVITAAADAAKRAYNAAKDAVLGHSPSKRFMWLGEDCDEGMAIGFRNGAGMVANAAANVAKGSLNVMSNTISKIGTSILDGIDAQPTIRPVMDLSEIQNGVKEANSLWGSNSMNIATSARVTKVTQPSVLDVLDDVVSATVNKVVASINSSDNSSLTIEVPLYMDGKQVAKATAPHINNILGVRTGLAARGQA